jgi:hypothetical protein
MHTRVVALILSVVLGVGALPAVAAAQGSAQREGAAVADVRAILPEFMASREAQGVAGTVKDPATAERVLVRLFAVFLGRRPAATERREGRAFLARTGDLEDVVETILESREFARRAASTADTVAALYRGVLGRNPSRDEVERWIARIPGDGAPSASPRTSTGSSPVTADGRRLSSDVGQRLTAVMLPLLKAMNRPLRPEDVRIGVMKDTAINAANAGGGEFYVTVGLLEQAGDDQLRGVMAHEVAHADLGHVAKLKRLGLGLNLGAIILDQIVPGAGAIAPVAGQLITNAYTRKEEYAADEHGATILQRAGFDGRRLMVDTLTWLQKATGGGSGGGFFATHPATDDRIEALRK